VNTCPNLEAAPGSNLSSSSLIWITQSFFLWARGEGRRGRKFNPKKVSDKLRSDNIYILFILCLDDLK